MTHRPSAITHTQEYTVLPGVVRHYIHLIFSVFSRHQTCAPLTQNPGDATGPQEPSGDICLHPSSCPPARCWCPFASSRLATALAIYTAPLSCVSRCELGRRLRFNILRAKLRGAVDCNRSCRWVCLFVCVWGGGSCYHDNSYSYSTATYSAVC